MSSCYSHTQFKDVKGKAYGINLAVVRKYILAIATIFWSNRIYCSQVWFVDKILNCNNMHKLPL